MRQPAILVTCWLALCLDAVAAVVVTQVTGVTEISTGNRDFDVNNDGLVDLRFDANNSGLLWARVTPLNGAQTLWNGNIETPLTNLSRYFDAGPEPEYAFQIGSDPHSFVVSNNPWLGPIRDFDWGAGGYLAYTFQDNGAINRGQFQNVVGYMGFSYQEGGQTHYGWFRVGTRTNSTAQFYEYAIETTPGQAIYLGSVPEPGRIALLMLGVMCWQIRRRRAALGAG